MKRNLAILAAIMMAASPAHAAMPAAHPAVRACTANDIVGTWRFDRFFEEPEDARMAQFRAVPNRYAYFDKNQTFVDLASKTPYTDPAALQEAVRAQYKTGLEQYVLNDKGVLYLYAKGKPTGGFYCQIVTARAGAFNAGDMLFRTTEPDTKRDVLRHYRRVASPQAKPEAKKP